MTTVLVTGATGNVGSSVVRELRGVGTSVHAFVRNPTKAAEQLGEGVEIAVGDFSDPASVRRAMKGADRVFLSSADGPQKVDHETGVIEAAAAAGVRLIVKASTIGAEAGSPLPASDWHGRIEDYLRQSGVPAVVLRSNFYMTNLLGPREQVRNQGKLVAPADRGQIAAIDPRDVGAVAAAVLTTAGHEGKTYVLTGSEAITYEQIAEALSAATGRAVEFIDVPEVAARQALAETGMPPWLVEQIVGVFSIIRQGRVKETTDTVRALTGREPRRFAQWAREHAALF